MGWPVNVVEAGGLPVSEAPEGYGTPIDLAPEGFGYPVTIVESGGLPCAFGEGVGGGALPPVEGVETFTASTTGDNLLATQPVQLRAIRRVGGSTVNIALFDSAFAQVGTPVFDQSMAADAAVTFSPPIECVGGLYLKTGTELVSNGRFTSDITGWTAQLGPTLSWLSTRRLQMVTGGGSGGRATQTVTGLTIGQTYLFEGSVLHVEGDPVQNANFRLTTSTDGSATGQVYLGTAVAVGGSANFSTTFVAAATSITIAAVQGLSLTVEFDNMSLMLVASATGSIEVDLAA